jgi:hypothetical protein
LFLLCLLFLRLIRLLRLLRLLRLPLRISSSRGSRLRISSLSCINNFFDTLNFSEFFFAIFLSELIQNFHYLRM